MHHPEFLECGAQAQADLPALCRLFVCHLLQRPLQGFAQIVVLLFQSLQQDRLLWAHHSLLCFLCQSQEVCSMSPSRYLRFPTSSLALQRILTNRLQHGKPWLLACLLLHALEQAFVGEGSYRVQDGFYCAAKLSAKCFYGLQGAATNKSGEP